MYTSSGERNYESSARTITDLFLHHLAANRWSVLNSVDGVFFEAHLQESVNDIPTYLAIGTVQSVDEKTSRVMLSVISVFDKDRAQVDHLCKSMLRWADTTKIDSSDATS